jgi:uncharacterized membrane protein
VVGFFQPGLTRLLTYKGIDALGVALTDPIRATTPQFSAMMAIIFLGEEITASIVLATFMIIASITLLSWRGGSMKLMASAVYLWYPIAASALAGASQVVRKFGLAAVPHPFLAAAVTATSSLIVSVVTMWYVEKTQETWKMNRKCFGWFLAAGITVSLAMICIYFALDLGKVSVVIPISSTGPFFPYFSSDLFARRRTGDAAHRGQRGDDCRRRDDDHLVEVRCSENCRFRSERIQRFLGMFFISSSMLISGMPGIDTSPAFWPALQAPNHFASMRVVASRMPAIGGS